MMVWILSTPSPPLLFENLRLMLLSPSTLWSTNTDNIANIIK